MNPGMFKDIAAGIPIDNDGRRGCESWREKSVVNREALEIAGAESRGRKAERIEDVVVWATAMVERGDGFDLSVIEFNLSWCFSHDQLW